MDIKIIKTQTPKPLPKKGEKLGFGRIFSDHMLVMDYENGAWQTPCVQPYGEIALSPAAMVLHYAQEIFEGLKAYKTDDGRRLLFRPRENFKRLNMSGERMVIPPVPEDVALSALCELIKLDSAWIPNGEGESLYIRPFIIATDPFVGVRPSSSYKFIIIMSPSGAYYEGGFKPVSIMVEEKYVRAVKGGVGFTKTGGNYAASLKGQDEAHAKGYEQVLWLDGACRKYIEEVGSMNIFFVIDGEVITPELSGGILSGITRKSVLELAAKWGYKTTERRVSIDEFIQALNNGSCTEVFGTGTAAVISSVGNIGYAGKEYKVAHGGIGALTKRLYDTLTGIQYGRLTDDLGWTFEV